LGYLNIKKLQFKNINEKYRTVLYIPHTFAIPTSLPLAKEIKRVLMTAPKDEKGPPLNP
tara:strand:+ start:42970 stop:43146 length:177 start_codon:yes stop_codon:yes gene_type:complete